MQFLKNSPRATVRMLTNGDIEKSYRHRQAEIRFANEVRILQHLEQVSCPFVPRLRGTAADKLRVVMSNCGHAVQHLPPPAVARIFRELESYGVRHDDPELRNITYSSALGRFCVIDFEFATLLAGNAYSASPFDLEQSLHTVEELVNEALS